MSVPAWAARYMGLEFDDAHMNCWGLVRQVFADQFKVELPSYGEEYRDARDSVNIATAIAGHSVEWVQVPEPEARLGDLVVFRVLGLPQHVGLVLDPPIFLHIETRTNSNLMKWTGAWWRNRIVGFYRHPALVEVPA